MTAPAAAGAKRALFIVNPHARQGLVPAQAVRERLVDGGLTLIDAPVPEGRSVTDVIRERVEEADLAIVGGGDGTLNAAAEGLVDTGLPLGILPLGTANDLARTLGIPPDPMQAAEVILNTPARRIDLGEVNGHLFFNVASIGFSAELAEELTAESKRRWGKLGYGVAAARLLKRMRLFTAFIEHDGVIDKVRTVQVSVGNGRHYGGGLTVAESATADDGKLDFYSLEVDHWWKLLALAPALRRGTHGRWQDVRTFRTTALTVRTSRPRPINTDGELSTWTPAVFRIRPAAVLVHAPSAGPAFAPHAALPPKS